MARARRGRGEGGIFRRADGQWVGTISQGYDANGKRRRRTIYGNSKRHVQEKMNELRNTPDQPKELRAMTVETYLLKWLDLVQPTIEHGTFRPYKSHVYRHINPYIGMMKLTELRRFHIEDLYTRLTREGVSPAMQKKIGTTLTIALGAALDKDMIAFNPTTRVKKPKAKKPEIHPFDADQVQLFLEASRADRLYSFYVCALDTGARPGELFALEWPDVDFARGSVTITKSLAPVKNGSLKAKDVKTKRGRRQIRLAPFTVDVLHEHRKMMLTCGFAGGPVFPSTIGGYSHLTNVHRYSFKPILKRAGLPDIRLYDLRHTCATLLLQAGENVKVVSERLGHATIVLTLDTYAHVLDGMQEQAATRMDGILNRKKKA